jgi:hypothetical protein
MNQQPPHDANYVRGIHRAVMSDAVDGGRLKAGMVVRERDSDRLLKVVVFYQCDERVDERLFPVQPLPWTSENSMVLCIGSRYEPVSGRPENLVPALDANGLPVIMTFQPVRYDPNHGRQTSCFSLQMGRFHVGDRVTWRRLQGSMYTVMGFFPLVAVSQQDGTEHRYIHAMMYNHATTGFTRISCCDIKRVRDE